MKSTLAASGSAFLSTALVYPLKWEKPWRTYERFVNLSFAQTGKEPVRHMDRPFSLCERVLFLRRVDDSVESGCGATLCRVHALVYS